MYVWVVCVGVCCLHTWWCVWLHVHACVCVHTRVCMRVDTCVLWGWCHLPWLLLHLILWGKASYLKQELAGVASVSSQPAHGILSLPSDSGIAAGSPCSPGAFLVSGGLNLAHLVCSTTTLITAQSCQPLLSYFVLKIKYRWGWSAGSVGTALTDCTSRESGFNPHSSHFQEIWHPFWPP